MKMYLVCSEGETDAAVEGVFSSKDKARSCLRVIQDAAGYTGVSDVGGDWLWIETHQVGQPGTMSLMAEEEMRA